MILGKSKEASIHFGGPCAAPVHLAEGLGHILASMVHSPDRFNGFFDAEDR